MTKAMHTPGRWECGELDSGTIYIWAYQHEGDDEGLLIGQVTTDEVPDADCDANARLIITAPELYNFARDCRDNWDCDADAHRHGTTCRRCEAEKVLAKATGAPCP
jgi:hypothetical protein